ncbi:hypothetical protein MYXO_01459 [Myxococcaceae bacterium]|nr:hypothetical protein MYXO_01459 [Myxococcaceae bacterium]
MRAGPFVRAGPLEAPLSRLEILDGKTWSDLVAAPKGVLVLGKSDCDACKAWSAELEGLLDDGGRWPEVRFGKLLLDHAGLVSFKRANPWVAELEVLPMNVIYREGQKVGEFAGGGGERLAARIERLLGS